MVLAFSCLVLLFLFAGKKKKVTKRKTAVCSFKAAARLRTTEAQELASLKQPALLFAVLRFSAFRLETEDGIFSLACSSLFALWAKSLWGGGAFACAFLLLALAFPLGEIAVGVGLLLMLFLLLTPLFALSSLGEIAGVSAKLLLTLLCSLLLFFALSSLDEIAVFFLALLEKYSSFVLRFTLRIRTGKFSSLCSLGE